MIRFVEDLPQIGISILFTLQAGCTFWGMWALAYSTILTVTTAVSMAMSYPFLDVCLSFFRPQVLQEVAPRPWRAKYAPPNYKCTATNLESKIMKSNGQMCAISFWQQVCCRFVFFVFVEIWTC